MLSEVSRWLDSAVRDYAEVRDGGLCMQTGPECGHAEVSASTLGLLPLEAGHTVGLSHSVDVWMENMECNFWMTNLPLSLSFLVSILRISKYFHARHYWGKWIRSFSFHSTSSCLGALDRSLLCWEGKELYNFLGFGCWVAMGNNIRRMMEVKQRTLTSDLSAGPSCAAHCSKLKVCDTSSQRVHISCFHVGKGRRERYFVLSRYWVKHLSH